MKEWKAVALLGVGAGATVAVLASCGSSTAAVDGTRPSTVASTSLVSIPGADRFSPFVTVVHDGAVVTFHNGDGDAHSVVSLPGSPTRFAKVLQPGESWTVTLTAVGTYHYYCSIHAEYDAATGQVRALPHADHPDEPMEGVVVVS